MYSHAKWKSSDDCLRVSKFCIPAIYNFAVIFLWYLLFLWKVAYILTVSTVFSFCKENFTAQWHEH